MTTKCVNTGDGRQTLATELLPRSLFVGDKISRSDIHLWWFFSRVFVG